MSAFQLTPIQSSGDAVKLQFLQDDRQLSFSEALELWADAEVAVIAYVAGLRSLGFEQLYWEHPPLTEDKLHHPYEVMVLKTQSFSNRNIDTSAFRDHIHTDKPVAVFTNLGGDARLVVPTLQSEATHYKQFGAFLANAPDAQAYALIKNIGLAMRKELDQGKTIWLSTAGLGVIWLHIRLDSRPKYYKTQAYKNPDYWN